MIEVSGVSRTYGNVQAVKNLSFSVGKGQVIGFLGPNGAGKSTTMKMMTGFLPPDSGSVKINGVDIWEDPITAKACIGFLPEELPVYKEMKVRDYLKFVAKLRKAEKLSDGVERAMSLTSLSSQQNRRIEHLSRGYRQRVGIAQALVHNPEVLILDEPTLGLDPKQVIEIRELIQQLRSQHTVILSTHILSEVELICDRVLILEKGELISNATISELKNKFNKKNVSLVLPTTFKESDLEKIEILRGADIASQGNKLTFSMEHSEQSLLELSRQVISVCGGILELRVEDSKLEDIFVQLTKDFESE